jgi:phenylalanyl-tRNA synthetase alpha chain
MLLFSIPDIRLMWSEDERFLSQFKPNQITTFKRFSAYPPCYKDISFWINDPATYHPNHFYDLVRNIAGDLVESVQQVSNALYLFLSFLNSKTLN